MLNREGVQYSHSPENLSFVYMDRMGVEGLPSAKCL